ncbi:MAG: hypothetical protein LBJ46_09365 [Planctomycetota bacterium]|jgi:superfamily II DNA helicase RecQ|nr:hypothetical protein [Planctomycetota bacterium]
MPGSVLDRTNATLRLVPCRSREKPGLLLDRLDAGKPAGAAVIRVRNEKSASDAAAFLMRIRRESRTMAPVMGECELARVASWFKTADNAALIVVEGLPFPERSDIRQAYFMNLPVSLEAVKTDLDAVGLDGLDSRVDVFASARDIDIRLAAVENGAEKDSVKQVVAWMEHDGCARRFLAGHLLGAEAGDCGNCGWCLGRKARFIPWE